MEAPEKTTGGNRTPYHMTCPKESVEYTRINTVIKRACEYISKHQCEYIDLDDFRKAMKGG